MTTRTKNARKVAIYARYSSDLQNDRSIEQQFDICRTYAAKMGWVVVEQFEDRAKSGASVFGRSSFIKMVEAAGLAKFDIVLAEDLDRLSRSQRDTAELYEDLTFKGLEIYTCTDGRINEMHVGIKGVMNKLYLTNLANKVHRGQKDVLNDGRNPGGDIYGYRVRKGEAGILDIDPDTSRIVKRIFEEYAAGASPRKIAAGLNRDGIPSPRGGVWNASTINGNIARGQGILLNERYAGVVVWNKRKNYKNPKTGKLVRRDNPPSEWIYKEVPHLRIIDEELFEAVKQRRTSAGTPNSRRAPRSNRLLSGLLRCGACGSGMTLDGHDRSGPRIRCSRHRESGSCANGTKYYVETIERLVVDRLNDSIDNPQRMGEYVEAYIAERRALSAAAAKNKDKLSSRLVACRKEMDRLIDAVKTGILEAHEVAAKLTTNREEAARLETEIAAADETITKIDLHPASVARFKRHLEEASTISSGEVSDTVRGSIRALIETVAVLPRQRGEPYRVQVAGRISGLIGEPDCRLNSVIPSAGTSFTREFASSAHRYFERNHLASGN
ncbi:recombinase family protein [Bradyrhizobium sp. CCGE-LA001]|uniref:recombinase family protein n=1 Tax=Bradyrhizobium sp. CCGE-LA001 TaxID=1223566 RepID=UPI0009F9AA9E|nr:recombinase family protein [Bradyrhizobium sp. CCGE-LA001]